MPLSLYLFVVNDFMKLYKKISALFMKVTTSDNACAQIKLNGTIIKYHFKRCGTSGTEDMKYGYIMLSEIYDNK